MLLRRYHQEPTEVVAETAAEVAQEKGEAMYTELTVPELKAILDEKGIEYNTKAKKQELITLLEGAN